MGNILLSHLKNKHVGQANAIKGRDIQTTLGINPRQVRKIVHDLRLVGHPICSGQEGYYYAETLREIHQTQKYIKSRINELQNIYLGISQAIDCQHYSFPPANGIGR